VNYRGIGFSVADNHDGTWRWKLHPTKITSNVVRTIPSGQITGNQSAAIGAAHAAVDDWLVPANDPK